MNFSFLTDSLKPAQPLNGQNLLSAVQVFCQCSLELIIQMQLPLHLHLKTNRNMTGNSVKKLCFVVLNLKLQVKLDSKHFIDFKNCYILLLPWT